jgi:hypothetical protein
MSHRPQYAQLNRHHWDADAEGWADPGRANCNQDEPAWGVPESQLGLLPPGGWKARERKPAAACDDEVARARS